MSERKMARIVQIDDVITHPNADALDLAIVGGWQCVVKRDEYKKGDLAIYCEIDSWIPNEIAPFLSKGKEPREYNGVKGEKLRTIRLRGELSQGLLLPISILEPHTFNCDDIKFTTVEELASNCLDEDISEVLGIQKWEPPINAQLAGQAKGNFPSEFPKTDAERIQNLSKKLQSWIDDEIEFEITQKLDGSSMTVAHMNGEVLVCSRNLSLEIDQEGNSFVDAAKRLELLESIKNIGIDISIQGELLGGNIQKNPENLKGFEFFVFEIFNIKERKYLTPQERYEICERLNLKHVPIIEKEIALKKLNLTNCEEILKFAEGKSLINSETEREGLVFKSLDGCIKFKAISNNWLLNDR